MCYYFEILRKTWDIHLISLLQTGQVSQPISHSHEFFTFFSLSRLAAATRCSDSQFIE